MHKAARWASWWQSHACARIVTAKVARQQDTRTPAERLPEPFGDDVSE